MDAWDAIDAIDEEERRFYESLREDDGDRHYHFDADGNREEDR